MKTEAEICQEAFILLNEKLGIIETETFIASLLRDPFDYTQWQRNLWEGKSLKNIFDEAKEYERNRLEKS